MPRVKTTFLMRGFRPFFLGATVLAILAGIEGDREGALATQRRLEASGFIDPEGMFFQARSLVRAGETEIGLETLRRVVEQGFCCPTFMLEDPWLASLRGEPGFESIVNLATRKHRAAAEEYTRLGGQQILGTGTN